MGEILFQPMRTDIDIDNDKKPLLRQSQVTDVTDRSFGYCSSNFSVGDNLYETNYANNVPSLMTVVKSIPGGVDAS